MDKLRLALVMAFVFAPPAHAQTLRLVAHAPGSHFALDPSTDRLYVASGTSVVERSVRDGKSGRAVTLAREVTRLAAAEGRWAAQVGPTHVAAPREDGTVDLVDLSRHAPLVVDLAPVGGPGNRVVVLHRAPEAQRYRLSLVSLRTAKVVARLGDLPLLPVDQGTPSLRVRRVGRALEALVLEPEGRPKRLLVRHHWDGTRLQPPQRIEVRGDRLDLGPLDTVRVGKQLFAGSPLRLVRAVPGKGVLHPHCALVMTTQRAFADLHWCDGRTRQKRFSLPLKLGEPRGALLSRDGAHAVVYGERWSTHLPLKAHLGNARRWILAPASEIRLKVTLGKKATLRIPLRTTGGSRPALILEPKVPGASVRFDRTHAVLTVDSSPHRPGQQVALRVVVKPRDWRRQPQPVCTVHLTVEEPAETKPEQPGLAPMLQLDEPADLIAPFGHDRVVVASRRGKGARVIDLRRGRQVRARTLAMREAPVEMRSVSDTLVVVDREGARYAFDRSLEPVDLPAEAASGPSRQRYLEAEGQVVTADTRETTMWLPPIAGLVQLDDRWRFRSSLGPGVLQPLHERLRIGRDGRSLVAQPPVVIVCQRSRHGRFQVHVEDHQGRIVVPGLDGRGATAEGRFAATIVARRLVVVQGRSVWAWAFRPQRVPQGRLRVVPDLRPWGGVVPTSHQRGVIGRLRTDGYATARWAMESPPFGVNLSRRGELSFDRAAFRAKHRKALLSRSQRELRASEVKAQVSPGQPGLPVGVTVIAEARAGEQTERLPFQLIVMVDERWLEEARRAESGGTGSGSGGAKGSTAPAPRNGPAERRQGELILLGALAIGALFVGRGLLGYQRHPRMPAGLALGGVLMFVVAVALQNGTPLVIVTGALYLGAMAMIVVGARLEQDRRELVKALRGAPRHEPGTDPAPQLSDVEFGRMLLLGGASDRGIELAMMAVRGLDAVGAREVAKGLSSERKSAAQREAEADTMADEGSGIGLMIGGAGLAWLGWVVSYVTYNQAAAAGGKYVIWHGPIIIGVLMFLRGLVRVLRG